MTETLHDPAAVDPATIAGRLPPVEQALVLLDFDGVLSHLVDEPDRAAPAEGAVEVLAALADRTRVVVVSGRPVDDLRRRLPTDLQITWAGGHGAEVATGAGEVEPQADVEVVQRHRDAARTALEELLGDAPGWHLEVKPTGLAVHSRLVADPTTYADRVQALLVHHAGDQMEVTSGHDVVELRPKGLDKGVATRRLLADDDRVPVAIGDDVTDEDTFAVVVEHGGTAILVATDSRATRASVRVHDPDEVVALLRAWLDRQP